MPRRILAAIVAVTLAAVAAVLVINYVSQADERAMADMSPETVLIVTDSVAEGTPASELQEYVTEDDVPAATVVSNSLTSLEDVAGQVTTAPLYPGEQLVPGRFARPEDLEPDDEVQAPEGFHQITVQLPTTRVIGGHLAAGDTVGFFVSPDDPEATQLTLQQVLVTRVQGGVSLVEDEDGAESTEPAADTLMVTLAVEATDAKLVAHAAEFHGIWLSLEHEDSPEDETDPVNPEDVLE
jgi:pilus assembly protein CpaB